MSAVPTLASGVKGHVVSMQASGWHGGKPVHSVAVCECGWSNTVAWGEYEAQDRSVHAHWASVELPHKNREPR